MRVPRLRLLTYGGIPFRIDPLWLPAGALATWSLAAVVLPAWHPGLDRPAYWVLGVVAALMLFASVVLHELTHAHAASRHGVPVRGISLFLLGGVAELGGDPPSATVELRVSGPAVLASVAIGLAALAAAALVPHTSVAATLLRTAGAVNLLLGAVNAMPAYPLAGGRVLCAWLGRRPSDILGATRAAAQVGITIGLLFIGAGAWRLLAGDPLGGVWLCVVGLSFTRAADTAYQQVVLRRALADQPVRRFMTEGPIAVPADTTLATLVGGYMSRYHHHLFPVQDNGRLLGAISDREVRRVPRAEWPSRRVGPLAAPVSADSTVTPDTSALEALSRMQSAGRSRLVVVDNGRLVGILTVHDLLGFLRRYGYEPRPG